MSNIKTTTKEMIVSKALEMYNIYGVEYVGVRELAVELNIKGGNITYYFPTKKDLLREISDRLTTSNKAIIEQLHQHSLYDFMEMNRRLYVNQYQYRSFFISLSLWIQQDIDFAQNYRNIQNARKDSFTQILKDLTTAGYLLSVPKQDLNPIIEALSATSRLWITEATIDGLIGDEKTVIPNYLKRMAGLLNLIALDKGKADLQKFLHDLDFS